MGRFWMVWNEQGRAPTYKHPSYESARREAERLARLNDGAFHVLVAISTCVKNDVRWIEHDDYMQPPPF